jgi:hypothetical protein
MAVCRTRRKAHTARPCIPLGAGCVTHLLTVLKALVNNSLYMSVTQITADHTFR